MVHSGWQSRLQQDEVAMAPSARQHGQKIPAPLRKKRAEVFAGFNTHCTDLLEATGGGSVIRQTSKQHQQSGDGVERPTGPEVSKRRSITVVGAPAK